MSLAHEILSVLKDEGYKVNEAVREALNDFITIIEEETDGVDDEIDDDVIEDDD